MPLVDVGQERWWSIFASEHLGLSDSGWDESQQLSRWFSLGIYAVYERMFQMAALTAFLTDYCYAPTALTAFLLYLATYVRAFKLTAFRDDLAIEGHSNTQPLRLSSGHVYARAFHLTSFTSFLCLVM
jgi:hypothetical protein